jgi:hypothetical protein
MWKAANTNGKADGKGYHRDRPPFYLFDGPALPLL